MSWNTGSEKSRQWSPRRRSVLSSSTSPPPTRGKKRGPDEVKSEADSGPRKSLRLKLFDLKKLGDIINVGYGQREEVALNSKYSAEDVLKTIATKDVSDSTCESNLRTPLPSEGRENEPKQDQQVKQESPEVASKRKAVSRLRKVRAVKSPRLIHSVCKKCKVGFIDPTVLVTHKCNDRATVVNQSQESANRERDGRRNERRGNHQEREQNSDQANPSTLCRQSHRYSHPRAECKSGIPQVSPLPSPDVVSQNCEMGSLDVSVSQGKPRKRLTQIEWFPAPIEVWIGYKAVSCMCMTCAACIPSLQVLLQHYLPRPSGTLTCKACQVDFVSNCYRFVHNLKNHQFICPFCPKRFKTKTIAKTHTLKQHQDQDLHEVHFLTFTRDGKLPIDLTELSKPPSTVRAQILGKVKSYKKGQMGSMICGKILGSPDTALSFRALQSLQDDHKAGEGVPRAMVKCLLCLEDIPGYVTLEEHMIVTHTPRTYEQLRAVVGEDRKGETEPRNSISIPVNGNNTSLSTPFCNECQKVFQDTRALKRHNLSVHSVTTAYRVALSQKLTESKQREQLTNVLHSRPATKAEMLHVGSAQTKGKRQSRNGEVKSKETIHSGGANQRPDPSTTRVERKPRAVEMSGAVRGIQGNETTLNQAKRTEDRGREMINTDTVPKKVCTRPTVVKSRQTPRKEAMWHLPDALFSMSGNRGLTPDEVREVDALIRASVEELEIFKKGCYNFLYNPSHLRDTGATIAAYLKLKPVIDNKPMTPTARRNYESNLKFGFPMGHFNPEFEETPLFPTLSDIFHRTNGYKRSPLKIMTSSEIKRTVGMADAEENRSLRKKFAKAVEESFSLHAARQVRSVSRGSASTQSILNVQSHLYLSRRVCGHINSMIAASIKKKEGNSHRLANYQQRLHNLNLPPHLKRPVAYGTGHIANTNPVSRTTSARPGPSNLSQELQAARRSFLAVGSQSVSTVVNIPQVETKTADGRLVPSGSAAGTAGDLADPQSLANVMRSLNQPMRPLRYPNTILTVPVSALQRQDGQVGVAQIPGSTTLSAPIGVGPASYIILPSHPVTPSLTSHVGHVMSPSLATLMPNLICGSVEPPRHSLTHTLIPPGGSIRSVNHPVTSNSNAESSYVFTTIPLISNLASHGGSGMPTGHPTAPSSTHIRSAAGVSTGHPVAPSLTHIPSAAGVSTSHPVAPSLTHIPSAAGVSTSHPVAPSLTHIPSAAGVSTSHPVAPSSTHIPSAAGVSTSNPVTNSMTTSNDGSVVSPDRPVAPSCNSQNGPHNLPILGSAPKTAVDTGSLNLQKPLAGLQSLQPPEQSPTNHLPKAAPPPLTPMHSSVDQTNSHRKMPAVHSPSQNTHTGLSPSESGDTVPESTSEPASEKVHQKENQNKTNGAIQSLQDKVTQVISSHLEKPSGVDPTGSSETSIPPVSTADTKHPTSKTPGDEAGSRVDRKVHSPKREMVSKDHPYSIPNLGCISSLQTKKFKKAKKRQLPLGEAMEVTWFCCQQIKRVKYEKKLKRSIQIREDYLHCLNPTRRIKRTSMSARKVTCIATSLKEAQLITEAINRGRRASIKLDKFHKLYKKFSASWRGSHLLP